MKIKELRAKYNINQKELAKITGLSQKSISNYENSQTFPNVEVLIKLADYFHVTVDSLLEHEVPYLLDMSTLSEQKKELIKKIALVNDRLAERTEAYLNGLMEAEEESRKNIEDLRKRLSQADI